MPLTDALAIVRSRTQRVPDAWTDGAEARVVNIDELVRREMALAEALAALAIEMTATGLPHADEVAAYAEDCNTKPALALLDAVFPSARC
jgi:alcohol dehydrogenase class IV